HGCHQGILEPQPLGGVVQLDVHAQVVGVELELVTGLHTALLRDVHGERGDPAVHRQAPVLVLRGRGAEVHVRHAPMLYASLLTRQCFVAFLGMLPSGTARTKPVSSGYSGVSTRDANPPATARGGRRTAAPP